MNNETLQLITSVTKQDRPRGNAVIVRFASDKHARRFLDEFGDEVLSAQGVPRARAAGDAGTIQGERTIQWLDKFTENMRDKGWSDRGIGEIIAIMVDTRVENAAAATAPVSAAPAAVQELPALPDFTAWITREMPAGTVIADPAWWAPRILRAALAMRQPQVQVDRTETGFSITIPAGLSFPVAAKQAGKAGA